MRLREIFGRKKGEGQAQAPRRAPIAQAAGEAAAAGLGGEVTEDSAREAAFKMARDPGSWASLRALCKRTPAAALWRGGRWGETLLHWAAITEVGGLIDLIALGAELDAADSEGRRAIDWAAERLAFTRMDPPQGVDAGRLRSALEAWEACASHLAAAGADLRHPAEGKAGGYSLAELALRAGSVSLLSALLAAGEAQRARASSMPWLLAWMAGKWESREALGQSLELLLSAGVDPKAADRLGESAWRVGARSALAESPEAAPAVALLASRGADPGQPNHAGASFWDDVADEAAARGEGAEEAVDRARERLGLPASA